MSYKLKSKTWFIVSTVRIGNDKKTKDIYSRRGAENAGVNVFNKENPCLFVFLCVLCALARNILHHGQIGTETASIDNSRLKSLLQILVTSAFSAPL
jgi:hypothetical protein